MKTPEPKITTPPTQPQQQAQQQTAQQRTVASAKPRHPRVVKKPTLNRSHVTKAVATVLKISDNKARVAVDAVLDAIKTSVRSGHAVELRGFCRFEVCNVKARSRVDMKDVKAGKKGAAVGRVMIPDHAVVKATASPVFLGRLGAASAQPKAVAVKVAK